MIIEVRKLDLTAGEEVLELGDKVMRALSQSKAKLKKSLRLIGIYNDHIITRDAETGRLFKMALSRGDAGAVVLGDPEEVQQSFATLTELREQKKLKEAVAAKKVMVETGETAGHKHEANVDADGNGTTSSVNGHQHEVQEWKVAPAGAPPHAHTLQQPEGEEEMKKPAKKSEGGDDPSPEYVKIEKASLWKGVV